jgi:hypothetical protein
MNAIVNLLVVAAAALAQPPEEYFGKPEKLPLSGPIIGKNLPYRFGAVQASGKSGSLSSNLE